MERKKKVKEPKTKVAAAKAETDGAAKLDEIEAAKRYAWADLVIQCKCGHTQTLKAGMNDGLQLLLYPTDESFIKLMCDKCDSELTLRLIEGVMPEDVDVTETSTEIKDEGVQEENKQEEVL